MQTLRFFLFSFFILSIISNAQTVIPPGDVSGTWAIGGSPFEIQGEITIPYGLTLTIEPGVLVEFQGHYKLNVQGSLLAVGTETDTITFTINDTTGFHDPTIPDGGWHGIRLIDYFSLNDTSKLIYCKLQYGKAIGANWPDDKGGAICVDGFDKLIVANCLIINNFADGVDWPSGGGIYLDNSNSKIVNNTISHNLALNGDGGGIHCNQSSPLIDNNIIEYNIARAGGGISCTGNPNPTITNTTIENNSAQVGGGINCYESSPQIAENIIRGNVAESGGGIVCNENSNPIITNTTIDNNLASNGGGGIVCWVSSLVLDNVTFSNNSTTGGWGGGISTWRSSDLQIDNCSFVGNEAPNASGGAIAFGTDTTFSGLPYQVTINNTSFLQNTAGSRGGVFINNGAWTPLIINVTIDNCEFLENESDHSTGLNIRDCSFSLSNSVFEGNTAVDYTAAVGLNAGSIGTVSNCLFASNVANTGGGNGNSGGVSIWSGSNVDVMNCTLVDNSASHGAGLTVAMGATATTTNCIFWGNSTDQIALDTLGGQGGTLTVNYCDIQDGENSVNVIDPSLSTLTWGVGNIDADPIFEDPLASDYHLQDTSTCIGAGIDGIEINGIMCYCPDTDIEGNPRPNPVGSMPDMGAYESPEGIVGVEDNEMQNPTEYALYQNYPNPFNPMTKIKYSVPQISKVSINIYNINGELIKELLNEEKNGGSYIIVWDSKDNKGKLVASGTYFYQIKVDDFVKVNNFRR